MNMAVVLMCTHIDQWTYWNLTVEWRLRGSLKERCPDRQNADREMRGLHIPLCLMILLGSLGFLSGKWVIKRQLHHSNIPLQKHIKTYKPCTTNEFHHSCIQSVTPWHKEKLLRSEWLWPQMRGWWSTHSSPEGMLTDLTPPPCCQLALIGVQYLLQVTVTAMMAKAKRSLEKNNFITTSVVLLVTSDIETLRLAGFSLFFHFGRCRAVFGLKSWVSVEGLSLLWLHSGQQTLPCIIFHFAHFSCSSHPLLFVITCWKSCAVARRSYQAVCGSKQSIHCKTDGPVGKIHMDFKFYFKKVKNPLWAFICIILYD